MTARQALGVGLTLIGVVVLLIVVVLVQRVLAVIFLGVVVGLTLSPIADGLSRYHVPRALAVLSVYLVIAVAIGAFGWYAGQSVASDLDKFGSTNLQLPGNLHLPSGEQVRSFLKDHAAGLSTTITSSLLEAANVLIDFVTVFVIGVLFVVARDHLQSLVLDLTPLDKREETTRVMLLLGHRVRRAVLGLFIGMVVIGVLVYAGLRIIGLPFPFVLAFIAFLTEIIPFIGPWLAFIPAELLAVTQGWVMMIETAGVYLLIYQFENHVLVPILHSTVNRIPALLVVVAVLIGGTLMGIIGALVAVPVAVIVQTLFFEVFEPWWQRRMGIPEPPAADSGDAE
jgi:predicted PurR-regulated permease PerM